MKTLLNQGVLRTNTILYCEHFERTIHFYRDVLQLPINHATDWLVEFKLRDQAFLSIADTRRTTIDTARGAGLTLSFQVENLEQAHAELVERGLTPTSIRTVWQVRVFFVYDPEGHRIEFWA